MNTRELFYEIMNFNTGIRTLKCEFGYWGRTIKNWYKEGLPIKNYPKIPEIISTIGASLYTFIWTQKWKNSSNNIIYKDPELPDGFFVSGRGGYWPNQGSPLDIDVSDYFGFDDSFISVNVEQIFCTHFEMRVLSEDDKSLTYIDIDGVTRKFLKKEATIPTAFDWPIKDWNTWNEIKENNLNINNFKKRFPDNWNRLVKEYKNRNYPLTLGSYPVGIFGVLAHLIGYENLFYFYYDKPDLIKDILNTFTDLWISVWEEVLSKIDVDCFHYWEDVSTGRASMISPDIFREFMTPYYKKLNDFLRSKGVNIILLDTDGDCNELIPLFLEAGITGLYPMEVSAGMDILKARKMFPKLQMMGGINKSAIALGPEKIDEILESVEFLLKTGGYIPFGDHFIPPNVSWENFKYYRQKLNNLIERAVRK